MTDTTSTPKLAVGWGEVTNPNFCVVRYTSLLEFVNFYTLESAPQPTRFRWLL